MNLIKKINFDQICALVLLVFAILYFAAGTAIDSSFYSGPFGPHHWVYTLGVKLAVCCIWLFFDYSNFLPDKVTLNEVSKSFTFLLVIFIYNQISPYLGFLISMPILLVIASVMFGAKLRWAVISSLVMSSSCFLLFEFFLKISLGSGSVFR